MIENNEKLREIDIHILYNLTGVREIMINVVIYCINMNN